MNKINLLVQLAVAITVIFSSVNGYTMSFAPCSYEQVELKASTPVRPVVSSALLATEMAAIAVALEHGSPAGTDDGKKVGFGLGVMGANYLIAFLAGGCHPSDRDFKADPLSDEERTQIRGSHFKRMYILGGIEVMMASTLLLVAEHPANRILAGAAIAVPFIAGFIYRDRFERGPALSHREKVKPEIGLNLVPNASGTSVAPAVVAILHF